MNAIDADCIYRMLTRAVGRQVIVSLLEDPHERLYAPELIKVELFSKLKVYCRRNGFNPQETSTRWLDIISQFPLEIISTEELLPYFFDLDDDSVATPQLLYIATALHKSVPLVTLDEGLAISAIRQGASVIHF